MKIQRKINSKNNKTIYSNKFKNFSINYLRLLSLSLVLITIQLIPKFGFKTLNLITALVNSEVV
jgi:hypothetical protein